MFRRSRCPLGGAPLPCTALVFCPALLLLLYVPLFVVVAVPGGPLGPLPAAAAEDDPVPCELALFVAVFDLFVLVLLWFSAAAAVAGTDASPPLAINRQRRNGLVYIQQE